MDKPDVTAGIAYPEQDPVESDNPGTGGARTVSRRNFFRQLGGGIAVALTYSDLYGLSAPFAGQVAAFSDGDVVVDGGAAPGGDAAADEGIIAAWVHIREDGRVTVFTGKVEVGQNIRTSLAQVVAEELAVPLASVDMIMGDTLLTPYDRGTYGSLTTPQMGPKLRKAAASLKGALLDMAAEQWNTSRSGLKAAGGRVTHPASGRSLDYGQLTKGKKIMLPVNQDVQLTPPEQWTVAGTPAPKTVSRDFVTGAHKYASDMTLPGMVYGKILRPPSYGATLVSANVEKAKTSQGINIVKEGDFIGVTAPDPQTAANAVARIDAQWNTVQQPSKAGIFAYLKENSSERDGDGNAKEAVEKAFAASDIQLRQQFEVQYIAHVPLEPRAALATWEEDGQLTVWTGTQRPFGVQEELQNAFSMPKEKIRVYMPDTGSAFGGKHSGEAALEAARLSKAVGKPVKVVWTREEEFKWAYLRPAGLIEATAGAGKDGTITSWEFHNYNSGGAGIDMPYRAGNTHIRYHRADSPLRQGSYRALASTANVFAIESMMDDLARTLKRDPLEFRLSNLDDERLKNVLTAAASRFGWKKEKPAGHGYGIACGFAKNAYIATCAEVVWDRPSGKLDLLRAVAAFECGTIVNPLHLEGQVMGAMIQGIGGALFEEIDFADGRILNPTLSTYRVPRFTDVPELDIVLVNRKDIPSVGAGEAPIVGIAPAIRNAILDATGIHLYNLPMIPRGLETS